MGLFFVLQGFSDDPPEGDLSFLGSFIPNIAVHVDNAGWAGWVLIVVYVASQLGSTLLMPTGADPQQQMMRRLFMVMPFIFVFFVIRFPVGPDALLDLDEPLDGRSAGHAAQADGAAAEPAAAQGEAPKGIPKPTGGKGLQGAGRSRRR